MIFDPLYFLMVLPALILAMWAQSKVKGTYQKYSQVPMHRRLTGAQVARQLLDSNNLSDVSIEMVQGHLSDHYDPRARVLRLSPQVHNGTSIAAAGIAAHETGHAIQHGRGYLPLHLRTAVYPVAGLGSQLAFPLFFIGLILSGYGSGLGSAMMMLGVLFFGGAVIFTLITLPVEFNASARALQALRGFGYLDTEEIGGAKKVLTAAAMTYVASALMAIMQFLYMLTRARR